MCIAQPTKSKIAEHSTLARILFVAFTALAALQGCSSSNALQSATTMDATASAGGAEAGPSSSASPESGASGTPKAGENSPTQDSSSGPQTAGAGQDASSSSDGSGPAAEGSVVRADAEAGDAAAPEGSAALEADAGPPPDDAGVGWDAVPGILSRIVAPTFPNLDCDVTQYGGVGDGTTDNTSAFAMAIADCSGRGGGRVVVPAGVFFTGPIEIVSNINLYVSAGATIKFSTDPTKYLPVVKVSWEGSLAYNYHPLVWAHDATNVAITGSGTIDGNATANDWYAWAAMEGTDQAALRTQDANGVPPEQRIYGTGHYLRPGLIEFFNCTNVLFDSFTATNSPFWTIHPVLSKNITATNFHSLGTVPNTDGFDPEACTDVLINNATIQVGDDSIAIKAGRDRDGWTYYGPTQNVVIQQSTLISAVGGVAIGSEMSGGVNNVYVEDTTFSNTAGNLQYAFYIKAAVTRGGYVENVYARRLTVGTVNSFLYMTGHYVSGAVIGPTMFANFSNINIDTATVTKTTSQPFLVAGADATKPATGITLSNITVAASAAPALSAGSGHYTGLTATNVVVNGAPFNPPASAP